MNGEVDKKGRKNRMLTLEVWGNLVPVPLNKRVLRRVGI